MPSTLSPQLYFSTPTPICVVQVVTEYRGSELNSVLEACERMNNHLTAAVVSNDVSFQRRVLEATVNGTTYCGIRAR